MSKNPERILIVDDNPDTLQMIARKLKSFGWQVYTASEVSLALPLIVAGKHRPGANRL
jgi:CheY-like chemotaxis protein